MSERREKREEKRERESYISREIGSRDREKWKIDSV